MPTFISAPEAARRLGVSPRTVKRLVDQGQLAAAQVPGGHMRVDLNQVNEFIDPRLQISADVQPRPPTRRAASTKPAHNEIPRPASDPIPDQPPQNADALTSRLMEIINNKSSSPGQVIAAAQLLGRNSPPGTGKGKKPGVRGRPFPPGKSGNPLGRPPGAGKKQGPWKNLSVGTDRNG